MKQIFYLSILKLHPSCTWCYVILICAYNNARSTITDHIANYIYRWKEFRRSAYEAQIESPDTNPVNKKFFSSLMKPRVITKCDHYVHYNKLLSTN